MRPMVLLALPALALALAGCADDGEDKPPEEGRAPPAFDAPPVWNVGNFWVYELTGDREATYVVASETDTDYIMETDSDDLAAFDAVDDVSTLGPIRKSDLAGSQGDVRVEFFRWPLEGNASWTTTWDGVERRIAVRHAGGPLWDFEAHEGERLVVRYTYDADAGFLRRLAFLGPDGDEDFSMRLVSHGERYRGDLVSWHVRQVAQLGGNTSTPLARVSWDVADNVTDLWGERRLECTAPGVVHATFGPDDPPEHVPPSQALSCPLRSEVLGVLADTPRAGRWTYGLEGLSSMPIGYRLTVHERVRTVTPFA